MKTKPAFLLVAFLGLFSLAQADTLKLKLADAERLLSALGALDGTAKVNDMGKDKEAVITFTPCDLSGRVRLIVGRDRAALKAAIDGMADQMRSDAKRVLTEAKLVFPDDAAKIDSDPELRKKFHALWDPKAAEPLDIKLELLTPKDLKLDLDTDTNQIPASVIELLLPLIANK